VRPWWCPSWLMGGWLKRSRQFWTGHLARQRKRQPAAAQHNGGSGGSSSSSADDGLATRLQALQGEDEMLACLRLMVAGAAKDLRAVQQEWAAVQMPQPPRSRSTALADPRPQGRWRDCNSVGQRCLRSATARDPTEGKMVVTFPEPA